jgi:hypothetical protein
MTQGDITMKKIATTENLVDMLIKPILVLKFKHFAIGHDCLHVAISFRGFWKRRHEEVLCCDLIKFKSRWRFVM